LDEQDGTVVAGEPATRGEVERAGRVRLVLRRVSSAAMRDPKPMQFSMPTICDPLPAPDPALSLADLRVLVVDEDLWRDVERVPRRHAREVEASRAAIAAIAAKAARSRPWAGIGKDRGRACRPRIADADALENWYRSGRARTKIPG
jgi:hypothetical protein